MLVTIKKPIENKLEDMVKFLYNSMGYIVCIVIPPRPTPQDTVELE